MRSAAIARLTLGGGERFVQSPKAQRGFHAIRTLLAGSGFDDRPSGHRADDRGAGPKTGGGGPAAVQRRLVRAHEGGSDAAVSWASAIFDVRGRRHREPPVGRSGGYQASSR